MIPRAGNRDLDRLRLEGTEFTEEDVKRLQKALSEGEIDRQPLPFSCHPERVSKEQSVKYHLQGGGLAPDDVVIRPI